MWHLKIIVEKDTIEPDQYHAGHVYFYPSWLEDNITGIVELGAGQGNRVDEAAEAHVKYERLRKRALKSEARNLEQHKLDMESLTSEDGRSTPAQNDLILRLEQKLLEFTAFMRLNYYPLCPIHHLALGVGRHKDSGTLTVLAQDDVGGLEVKHKTYGEWIQVKPTPDAYIINVGDIVQV
uniref:Thebaine 6-O-demethylase-like n=2 Tax=Nicotiana TaxID=4085 RepID=A0A1S4BTS0_TOBAC|nr:PREDICTED: thebaine 6-O-demethylase-like [Nicotiana tabacum]